MAPSTRPLTIADPDLAETGFDAAKLGINLPERFVAILSNAVKSREELALPLIVHTFAAIMRLGLLDSKFWESVTASEIFRDVVSNLVLFDSRDKLRAMVIKMIQESADCEDELPDASSDQADDHGQLSHRIARYFWVLGTGLMTEAVMEPTRCCELFDLLHSLMDNTFASRPNLVDFRALAVQASGLLVRHEPTEASTKLAATMQTLTAVQDINQVEPLDPIPRGLVCLLLACIEKDESIAGLSSLPE